MDLKFQQQRIKEMSDRLDSDKALKNVNVGFPTRPDNEEENNKTNIAPGFPTGNGGQFTDYRNPSGNSPGSKEFENKNDSRTLESGPSSPRTVTF